MTAKNREKAVGKNQCQTFIVDSVIASVIYYVPRALKNLLAQANFTTETCVVMGVIECAKKKETHALIITHTHKTTNKRRTRGKKIKKKRDGIPVNGDRFSPALSPSNYLACIIS